MPVESTFKTELMSALHSAVGAFNAGGDPNAAVVKTARDYDFNSEQTSRLLETFNTARTIYHYKSAADKASEFQLAEPGRVIPALFEEEPKEAVVLTDAVDHDYSTYNIPEAHYEDGTVIGKTAGVQDVDFGDTPEFTDTDLNTLGNQAYATLRVQRDLAKTARDESRVAGTQAKSILDKAAASLARGYEEDVKDKYSRLGAMYSDTEFSPVMSKFAEFVPMHLHADPCRDRLIEDRDLGEYKDAVKEARYWMETEAEMDAMAGTLDKEADDFESKWLAVVLPVLPKQAMPTVADFVNPELLKAAQIQPPRDWVAGGGEGKGKGKGKGKGNDKQDGNDKQPDKKDLGNLIPTPISAGLEGRRRGWEQALGPAAESGVEGQLESFLNAPSEQENTALSERLKDTQRKLMLEDLMVNDPVLSEEDPQAVANAYNAVAKIAPEVASNKEVVRAILRQVVHSMAIGAYDAKSWTDLEKNLRNIAGKTDVKDSPVR